MTVKPCSRLVVGGQRSGQIKFIEVFSFISTHDLLNVFPQILQEQMVGKVEI